MLFSPATMLVDFFPISEYRRLQASFKYLIIYVVKLIPEWCPGGGFKTKAAVAHKYVSELYEVPYRMVREKMVSQDIYTLPVTVHKRPEQKSGTARPSFTSNLLERLDRVGKLTLEEEENIKAAAATVYSGSYVSSL